MMSLRLSTGYFSREPPVSCGKTQRCHIIIDIKRLYQLKQQVQLQQEFHEPWIIVTHCTLGYIGECVLCSLHKQMLPNVILLMCRQKYGR